MAAKTRLQSAGDGSAVPAGYVGEINTQTWSGITIATSATTVCTFSNLSVGNYLMIIESDASIGTSTRLLASPANYTGTAVLTYYTTTALDFTRLTDNATHLCYVTVPCIVTTAGSLNVRFSSTTASSTNCRGRVSFIRIA